ncbi:MAG: Gfo/Idh/MocA family oxidoreductase [Bryobacterales bacterium]|nr:Gfo/Idh/MocA family oxidoreductase [Bryobacterales bacterium]
MPAPEVPAPNVTAPDVVVVGGGMITHDQILPSLYQLQIEQAVGEIHVVAQHGRTLRELAAAETIRRAFPESKFRAWPAIEADPDKKHPRLYEDAFRSMRPGGVAIIALPDQLHFDAVMAALGSNLHVICVKPLVLRHEDAMRIEREAKARGLFVGVEYHKRFDDRSLIARRRFRAGMFGELRLGTACLMEKWYYRHSKFQNWFGAESTDAFTYIGCHYVDLVHFITGLLPTAVSVYGIKDRFPNGLEGYLWTDARVIWENGACLNVQNSLSFPDAGPGSNTQGMTLYFGDTGKDRGGFLSHDDQYRGMRYAYLDAPASPGATAYHEPSTDYFQYLDVGGKTLLPVGYGYRSVARLIEACSQVESLASKGGREASLGARREMLNEIDAIGILATPANSAFNELVVEAGRLSLADGGKSVEIVYGNSPHVAPGS